MIHLESGERFTVRHVRLNNFKNVPPEGYAVFDGERRITIPFEDLAEARRQCRRITETYEKYGWKPIEV